MALNYRKRVWIANSVVLSIGLVTLGLFWMAHAKLRRETVSYQVPAHCTPVSAAASFEASVSGNSSTCGKTELPPKKIPFKIF